MYDNLGSHAGVQRPPLNPQQNPFGSAFYGAGSGSFEVAWVHMERNSWVQALNSCKAMYKLCPSFNTLFRTFITYKQIFSNPQYYFQVNDQYVRNKLKVVLFPFLHRGHWTRITEPVGGRLSYKPPIYDINVPDLYTPLMAFGTYVILAGFSFGLLGKFSPEALNLQFTRGLVGWFVQVELLAGWRGTAA